MELCWITLFLTTTSSGVSALLQKKKKNCEYGAYNMQKRNEIITIVDKTEYQKLMNYINHEDPQAFITVYNVSDMRYQPKV